MRINGYEELGAPDLVPVPTFLDQVQDVLVFEEDRHVGTYFRNGKNDVPGKRALRHVHIIQCCFNGGAGWNCYGEP